MTNETNLKEIMRLYRAAVDEQILGILEEGEPVTTTGIAARVGIERHTARRYLMALVEAGRVEFSEVKGSGTKLFYIAPVKVGGAPNLKMEKGERENRNPSIDKKVCENKKHCDSNLTEGWKNFFNRYSREGISELSNQYPAKRSLLVNFHDLAEYNPTFADMLLKEPDKVIEAATQTLQEITKETLHIRITNLPVITAFNNIDPNTTCDGLVSIAGIISQVRSPEPKIKIGMFECSHCHNIFAEEQPCLTYEAPLVCPEDKNGCGRRGGLKLLVKESTIVKTQQIKLRELSGEKAEKRIELEDDLINQYTLGDEVVITGVIRYSQKKTLYAKTAYLDWNIEVNSIERVVKEYDADTKSKAIELLRDPAILDRFADFLGKPGLINKKQKRVIVGEDNNKKLLFLAGLSARYAKQLHCIIIGQSGSGKSRLASLLNVFFPRQVEELFRATERAIDYLGGDLSGKILLLKEMAGGQASQYSLRIVMDPESEELRIWTVVKDAQTNEQRTIEKKTVGSPVFVTTTPSAYFDNQIKNRSWLLSMDESEEQTKEIFDADDIGRKPIINDLTSELNVYLCALQMLQFANVRIPFCIDYPTKNTKARRARSHLLDLVEVITFLRQYQRRSIEVGGNETDLQRYLIATPEDFELAKRIAENSISMNIEELTSNAKKLFELFEEEGWEKDADGNETTIKKPFTLKYITKRAPDYLQRSYSKTAIREFLNELDDANYITRDGGKPKHYYILKDPGLRIGLRLDVPTVSTYL